MRVERISDPVTLDHTAVAQALAVGGLVIQFSDPASYSDAILAEVDALCARSDRRVEVRFFGHYGSRFDVNILCQLPNVKSLLIDCLEQADNLNALGGLEHLEALVLPDIFDPDVLQLPNISGLRSLTVGSSRAVLDLKPLERFQALTKLTVWGQVKGLDVIGGLSAVTDLRLCSIKKAPLAFVNRMTGLKDLSIILGGRDSIDEIGGEQIENLELIRVRGFTGFSNLAGWTSLKTLALEDQIRVETLTFGPQLAQLNYLRVANCKGLARLENLAALPALQHLRLAQTALDFEHLCAAGLPASLRQFAFYTFKAKQDDAIRTAIQTMGYEIDRFG